MESEGTPPVLSRPARSEDSLRKRYTYKLFRNLIEMGFGGITAAIVPRAMGPTRYGDFSFLYAFFTQLMGFLDAGTSTAFYTKLSHRIRESSLVRFYWGYMAFAAVIAVAFVGMAGALDLREWFWPGQRLSHIWMAMIWGVLWWIATVLHQTMDAHGLTVQAEIVRTLNRTAALIILVIVFWTTGFGVFGYFLYLQLVSISLCLLFRMVMKRNGLAMIPTTPLSSTQIRKYSREFLQYSLPLLAYTVVSFLTQIGDRWLLQRFGGSKEQGYFGLSFQIVGLCALFTGAMTPLILREFSKAFGENDIGKMRWLFLRYLPPLYAVAAFLSVFVAVQANRLSVIFGGAPFQGASAALVIMALYPIHQTYGQLSGSALLASGRTRLYRNLGVAAMLGGLPLTLWILAPSEIGGLGGGAVGLAAKTVLVQICGVNLMLWYNARFLEMQFWKLLAHQFYSVVLLAVLAWLVSSGVERLLADPVAVLVVSGILYSAAALWVAKTFPSAFVFAEDIITKPWEQGKSYLGKWLKLIFK